MSLMFRRFILQDPVGSDGAPAGAPPSGTGSQPGSQAAGTPPVKDPPAGAPAGTVLDQPGGQPAGAPVESFWKDDWREKYAGNDERRLQELKRYASPKAALDGLFAAKQRISSGQLAPALKANATPEEIAEYRQAHGIPESPDKYEIKLSGDRKIEEEDKPSLDKLLTRLHAVHAKPEVATAVVEAFYDIEQEILSEQNESDKQARSDVEDALRAEWGGDFRSNVTLVSGMLDAAPEGVKDLLRTARNAEGVALLNDARIMSWLCDLAKVTNPTASVVPGAQNPAKAIQDERADIEAKMKDQNSEYWKGPKSAQLQARYRQLIEAGLVTGKAA